MSKEDVYNEEYSYDRMASFELGVEDSRKYQENLKSPDGMHPCVKYKTWIFSLLIGSCLLAISVFSLYLGNVYPSEMDYLRCAAGSCIPSAIVNFAVLKTKDNVISHYQILYVSTFSITTTCLIWFGCKLAINPTANNINFNVMLLILMEILMATTVIISARSRVDCCPVRKNTTFGSSSSLKPVSFPARMIKSYSIVEVVVGMSAVFGGIIALHIDALLHSPYLYISIFWVLAACFPCAVASHVAAEYPSPCLRFYEVLLLLLMLILLVQAVLSIITIIQCVHYKSQVKMQDSSWNVSFMDKANYRNNNVSNNTLRDKEKAWKAVMVQMAQ
ncbi:membrane protein MLC1 isoform X3 [Hyperolius riggenbachi]|uniref:membrane protein MLC1 isoform X3 n=1 Tax=Hyperolius riggenbachi TaxID=752182 RepID=UPI0035A2CD79